MKCIVIFKNTAHLLLCYLAAYRKWYKKILQQLRESIQRLLLYVFYSVYICIFSEDPYPSSSIDLKCKERVTDSDSENGSGDESERKVMK